MALHYENGVSKNDDTRRRFKGAVAQSSFELPIISRFVTLEKRDESQL